MKFRIVKEETLRFDGKVVVRYIPQYKGWLFWNRFEQGCDAFTYNYAAFDYYVDAKAFLENYARMKGLTVSSVVEDCPADGEVKRLPMLTGDKPIVKVMSTLEGASTYARLALETYPGSRVFMERDGENSYKVTIDKK